MTNQPATQLNAGEETIIPARRDGVTALCVHAFLAIIVALGLRLLFVYWFPASADDSAIYLQLANNWVDHHVYGLSLNGQLVPTDLRTPGYPAFLAGVALLLGRSMQAILLSQAVLDVLTCILTAALAAALAPAGTRRRVWIIALWLAATCPFLANYSAVVLTEVVVTFLATAALACFALGLRHEPMQLRIRTGNPWNLHHCLCTCWAHFFTGAGDAGAPRNAVACWPSRLSCTVSRMEGLRARERAILLCCGHGGRVSASALAVGRAESHFLERSCSSSRRAMPRSPANTRRLATTPGRGRGSNAIATCILQSGRSEKTARTLMISRFGFRFS